LYEVTFAFGDVWGQAGARDTVTADLYEHWLEPA
jgi:hypothetical protein